MCKQWMPGTFSPYPKKPGCEAASVKIALFTICVCMQALASLAEAAYEAAGGDEDPKTYLLSLHFGDIIQKLVTTADR